MAIPSDLSKVKFNKDNVSRMAKKQRAAEGYHAFIITDAQPHESKNTENHGLMTAFTTKMLKDPDDASTTVGQPVRFWQTWPLDNPDFPEYEAAQYTGQMAVNLLSAICEDVPAFPVQIRDKWYFQGEEIASEEIENCREVAVAAAGEKSAEVYCDPAGTVVGYRFFAHLEYPEKDGQVSDFPRLKGFAMEKDPKVPLSDVWMEIEGEEREPAEKPAKKGRGSRKKSK